MKKPLQKNPLASWVSSRPMPSKAAPTCKGQKPRLKCSKKRKAERKSEAKKAFIIIEVLKYSLKNLFQKD
jgi:hypothetical protein